MLKIFFLKNFDFFFLKNFRFFSFFKNQKMFEF